MEERASNVTDVFLDTAFAIALSSPKDAHHELAVRISERLEANKTRLVTTHAVIIEIGNALAKQAFRQAAIELIESLEQDPSAQIVPISEQLYERAFDLYRERPDKEWGLTDCISFVVMQDNGLTGALTTDRHFEQAGFQALMRIQP
ncbi:MAG: type II toxin-antitoxin system VapC family toxin [Acidobacteriota bacterium]